MNDKNTLYREVHTLQVNVYLVFYGYIFIVLVLANALPVLSITYYLFLFLGLMGTSLLLIKFTYGIAITENKVRVFVNVPFRIILLKLDISQIKTVEKAKVEKMFYPGQRSRNACKAFYFTNDNGVKLTMPGGKAFLISGINPDEVIQQIQKLSADK